MKQIKINESNLKKVMKQSTSCNKNILDYTLNDKCKKEYPKNIKIGSKNIIESDEELNNANKYEFLERNNNIHKHKKTKSTNDSFNSDFTNSSNEYIINDTSSNIKSKLFSLDDNIERLNNFRKEKNMKLINLTRKNIKDKTIYTSHTSYHSLANLNMNDFKLKLKDKKINNFDKEKMIEATIQTWKYESENKIVNNLQKIIRQFIIIEEYVRNDNQYMSLNCNDKVEPLNKQVYKPKTKNFCNQEEIFGCDNGEDTSNKLRMLLRFNCGRCQRKYSRIFIPTAFSKCCEKCNNPTDLVVLRSDETNLYGGYLCKNCENRFLTVLQMTSFKKFTPLCNNCNMYCKMYQALLNKSKISIRNIKVYVCNICKLECTKSFYQPYGNFDSSVPVCCGNKCSYAQIRREFTFHKLNEEGRSENFVEGKTKMHLKYNNQKFYEKTGILKNMTNKNSTFLKLF